MYQATIFSYPVLATRVAKSHTSRKAKLVSIVILFSDNNEKSILDRLVIIAKEQEKSDLAPNLRTPH